MRALPRPPCAQPAGNPAHRRVLLAGFLFASCATAPAQPPPATGPLTLDAAVAIALSDNAELNGLRARAAALRERPAQTATLPNPMLSVAGMDTARDGQWPDTGEKRLMLQQPLPGFGKRGLRRDVAAREADIVQYDAEAMALDLVMQVKEGYYDLHAVRQAIALTRSEEQTLRAIVTLAETLVSAGQRSQTDAIKAQTEVTMLNQKLIDLLAREDTLRARLNLLLNRPPGASLDTLAPPPPPLDGAPDSLAAGSSTNRPEVRAATARREQARLEQALMAREGAPDYTVGLEYRALDTEEDMVMATVGVELPLWRSGIRAGVREAGAMRTASEAGLVAAERRAAFDVQAAALQFQAARQTLALYESELIPQAEARYAASEAGYRSGKGDFMDLLESQRFRLNTKLMAAMTAGAVGMQAARLERALGVRF